MTVVTRFAPSPTGFLHIGGARTALFNWLFARHHGGKFLLRIEDTDRARSTQEAVDALIDGLQWMGLNWDEDPVFQFARADRHAEVAKQLLAEGKAYYCFASPEELTVMREEQKAAGHQIRYDGRWRDRDPSEAPNDIKPVIRLKAPQEGETTIKDQVQGDITVKNLQLDDFVLLRADGTPTYMLSVVVDDHDMGITHVVRGDDHLTNAARQSLLYQACGWNTPVFAHIPLIHGPDGAKLSKRHGALGAEAYRDMGILPEPMQNYLLRLGWGHGDDEIISTKQAIEWFELSGIGKSPSRFDMTKLLNLNAHYIKDSDNADLAKLIAPLIEKKTESKLTSESLSRVEKGMDGLKPRAKDLNELASGALIYTSERPLTLDEKAQNQLTEDSVANIREIIALFEAIDHWEHDGIKATIQTFAEEKGLKLGKVMQPLRAAITGTTVSPSMFEVMEIFGKLETLARLKDCLG